MHAGLHAVIYNAFETERGGARGDNIARREKERVCVYVYVRVEYTLSFSLYKWMHNKQVVQLTYASIVLRASLLIMHYRYGKFEERNYHYWEFGFATAGFDFFLNKIFLLNKALLNLIFMK